MASLKDEVPFKAIEGKATEAKDQGDEFSSALLASIAEHGREVSETQRRVEEKVRRLNGDARRPGARFKL
jgi:hypothetical protein